MTVRACSPRLILPVSLLVFVSAASAEERRSEPILDAASKAALREAAGSPSLDPWQQEFMLQLAGGTPLAAPSATPKAPAPAGGVGSAGGSAGIFAEGTWSLIPPEPPYSSGPENRSMGTAVYDPVRRHMVVFGGRGSPQLLNDVWVLKLDYPFGWAQLFPSGPAPDPRLQHGAIYDSARDRMIVFGGSNGVAYFNDTWALQFSGENGATWAPVAPSGSLPAPRADFAMIYDPLGDRVLVFGGSDVASRRSDLWQLSFSGATEWTQLNPGPGPSARAGHRGAYDSLRKRMVIFGGYDGNYVSDTWALALEGALAWTPIVPPGAPPSGRADHVLLYDPNTDRLVVHGGCDATSTFAEVWVLPLDPPGPWAIFNAGDTQCRHAAILDPVRRELLVLVDTGLPPSSTHVTDLMESQGWTVHPPRGGPSRMTSSAVYDPVRRRMVVFGGRRVDYSNEVWVLTLGQSPRWSQLFPTGPLPPKRRLHAAVYDQAGDRMIAFAGFDGSYRNDTWSLQFSGATDAAWTQIAPAGPLPPVRADFGMILDPVSYRLVVFGGFDGVTPRLGDTWTLSLSGTPTWTQLSFLQAPFPRTGHRAIYDPVRHRLVLFGGYDTRYRATIWELTLGPTPAWNPIFPPLPWPAPRADQALAYDAQRDRMVVHGGTDGVTTFYDTWVFPFTGAAAWSDITPPGGPSLWGCAGIYDAPYDRLVVFGGSDPYGSDRAFALTWDSPTPTLLALQSVEARPGLVRILWQGGSSEVVTATVYRRKQAADWHALGMVESDGSGRIVWEDRDVQAGGQYEYRLGILEDGREVFVGATSVVVPSGSELEVRAMLPEFAAGLALWCAVPLPGRARLEVVDVAGRRIAVRELDMGSAGAMRVEIAPAPPSGIYVARLSQGGRSALARVSVIH